MTRPREGLSTSFLDMAMTVAVILLTLVMILNSEAVKPTDGIIKPKAEFLIELTWTDGSPDDIDLYAKGPDGKIVFFGRRDTPLMFLDLDNTGRSNTVDMPDGSRKEIADRRETITIRATQPGEYVVNGHMYRANGTAPNNVKLTVTKINPYRVVTVVEAVMDTERQEKTLVNFTVDGNGGVSSVFLVPTRMVGE